MRPHVDEAPVTRSGMSAPLEPAAHLRLVSQILGTESALEVTLLWGATDNLSLLLDLVERRGCDRALIDRALQGRELESAEGLDWLADQLDHQIAIDLDFRKPF